MILEAAQSIEFANLPDADGIFGRTPTMRDVRTKIEAAIHSNHPLLIEGESGTGKEVVARYIHLQSPRAASPFVRIPCAAIQSTNFESELFGSGSDALMQSNDDPNSQRLELRTEGTLFLDEVYELDPSLQQRLARSIELGRCGDRSHEALNRRILCSSSVNLNTAILGKTVTGSLGSKLTHRVRLSPLRERKRDIPMLCEYLIGKAARTFGRPVPRISAADLERLMEWDWPGNIRELENWIVRVVVFGTEEMSELKINPAIDSVANRGRRHRFLRVPADPRRRSRRGG